MEAIECEVILQTENMESHASKNIFVCSQCGKSFTYKRNLKRHVLISHNGKSNSEENKACHMCSKCNVIFPKLYLLKKHMKEHAKVTLQICPICHFRSDKKVLLEHFHEIHNMNLNSEEIKFNSFPDFLIWKEETEHQEKCQFKKVRGTSMSNSKKYHYFECHRSGQYSYSGKGLRLIKSQGSNKINAFCPASINVIENDSGSCSITYIKNHIGHSNELGHLFLSEKEKRCLAEKIATKIPFKVILDGVRDSVSESGLERVHLLTNQDLHNIERQFNLGSETVHHQNDGISVDAWVKAMEEADSGSCVLFYKPQGELTENYSFLKVEDFILIIMNEAQEELVKKFGVDCVCMDGTHVLTNYGFQLITLLVLDDMRQGFPGAFLISNRWDEDIIILFLSFIKEKVGAIKPKLFMSDMAPSFINAWEKVMLQPELKLFCTWHVDRAWRKNLSKIKNLEKQAEVYKMLRILLVEREQSTFNILLAQVLHQLENDNETLAYALYFKEYYSKCCEKWAYCYRLHGGLNTNMHIERMHRTIKYIYLQGKNVKRLDKTIYALMQFVRDKVIDRLIILHKGKVSSKIREIRKRHKTSESMNIEITKLNDEWIVPSSSSNELYTVCENMRDCGCKLVCPECQVCIHKYMCTCIDSAVRWNMCKHIHLVCKLQVRESDDMVVDTSKSVDLEESEVLSNYVKNSGNSSKSFEERRKNIANKFLGLLNTFTSNEELDIFEKQMSAVPPLIGALNAKNIQESEITKCSVNKNIIPQRKFIYKKKTTKKVKKSITAPTVSEINDISLSLIKKKLHFE